MHRILLEQLLHEYSSFITLTYSEDSSPDDGSLRPCDLQKWLKRIRRSVVPAKLRFFGVGEYGDKFARPHYHVALFGYPSCVGGPVRNGACECRHCLGAVS